MPLAISPFIGPTISPPIGPHVLPAVQLTQNGVARNRLHCTDSVALLTFRTGWGSCALTGWRVVAILPLAFVVAEGGGAVRL